MQVVVDSLLTHYELKGKGKLVVLLHGWGDNIQGLAGLQSALSEHYKVLALDLPGFGQTQNPDSVWGLENYARFLQATLDKLKLPKLYAIVGHSNGGAVALLGLGTGILSAEKLVLLAAAGIRKPNSPKLITMKLVAKTGKVATFWLPPKYRRELRKNLYSAAGSDMLVVPELQETFKKTVSQDVQSDASNVSISTLIVYGTEDKSTPPHYGKRYSQLIKNSKLKTVEGAGHFLHHEKPQEIIKYIEDFLADA